MQRQHDGQWHIDFSQGYKGQVEGQQACCGKQSNTYPAHKTLDYINI